MRQTWRVEYRLRLLNLDEDVAKLVKSGAVTYNAAAEIAKLRSDQQTEVIRKISRGALTTDAAVTSAVRTIQEAEAQPAMFEMPVVSDEDLQTLSSMESAIEKMIGLVNRGFKDGECRVAVRVDPSKAQMIAEKLRLIRQTIGHMERDLEAAFGQRAILAEAA